MTPSKVRNVWTMSCRIAVLSSPRRAGCQPGKVRLIEASQAGWVITVKCLVPGSTAWVGDSCDGTRHRRFTDSFNWDPPSYRPELITRRSWESGARVVTRSFTAVELSSLKERGRVKGFWGVVADCGTCVSGVSCFPDSCHVRGERPGGSRTGRSPAAVAAPEAFLR